MMTQCLVLGLVWKPHDMLAATRIGRAYSVIWGLASIVLIALCTRRLAGNTAALFAALLLATSGINLVTSFWARGQINNVTFCLGSMLLALQLRSAMKGRALALLFGASALAGAAIATRWSVALVPMLLACAVARGPVLRRLAATGAGGLFGFFGSTGFLWTPDMIRSNLEMQTRNLVNVPSRVGPLTTGAAAVVCIVAATGLATFLLAAWFAVVRLRNLRRFPLEDLAGSGLRARLDSPAVIIGLPTAITFVMLCFNKTFDARYTDLFAPPLAIAAGIQLAALWQRRGLRVVAAALVAYQAVYAAGVLARYVDDPREHLQPALDRFWQPKTTLYATDYVVSSLPFAGHELGPGQRPWDADWIAAADVYMGMYLTASGTFSFFPVPPSCREIRFCDGEDHRRLFQSLYAGDGWQLVHVWEAAAWTPELKLYRALMTSKWMFTGDIRLFHRRPRAAALLPPRRPDSALNLEGAVVRCRLP